MECLSHMPTLIFLQNKDSRLKNEVRRCKSSDSFTDTDASMSEEDIVAESIWKKNRR
jgi:hypothetical protein